MKVLVTGGAGFVGSHTAVELAAAGHEPVLFDNLSNARRRTLASVRALAGRDVRLIEADVRDPAALDRVLGGGAFGGVVHLAGLKPGGAPANASRYHDNNVVGTATLAARMAAHGVKRLVFASSAAVYRGAPAPLAEDAPTGPAGPYGRSKLGAERALGEAHAAAPGWRMAVLRYFNAAGAHSGGSLGEDAPHGPGDLLARLGRVALGLDDALEVYGGSWPTADGTCVRDYVHVVDVARANVAALGALGALEGADGPWTVNVGTGRGHSVLETVRAFARASGREIPYWVDGRRAGDVAEIRSDPGGAAQALGWRPKADLAWICADCWRWQSGERARGDAVR